ncbi:MAG TPA: rhodanese-like domain-containing protein [Streptosporangiaceae bacterium]|nr:rhodanese-like domain-containing protein [Streptosporangiaceae bacterium]
MNQVPASGVPDGVYLLDVREDDEWTAGHAPEAVHIPLGELGGKADEVPKDRPVYVICRAGGRSARAAQALGASGWDVTNVSDGMQGWESAGRAMVSESGAPPFVA